jgi:large subunit ribosomal protein L13
MFAAVLVSGPHLHARSVMPRQTTFARTPDAHAMRRWRHVDADGKVLGRLATQVAQVLMGKHRPQYTPHVDTGDFVIITNAEKVVLTGKKAEQNLRKRWSGYPGGQKSESYGSLRRRRPSLLVEEAVKRMLPKTPLGRNMVKKLKVYAGPDHPHHMQRPIALDARG